jgi:hypothetical protein
MVQKMMEQGLGNMLSGVSAIVITKEGELEESTV